jgi:hypothetical protein
MKYAVVVVVQAMAREAYRHGPFAQVLGPGYKIMVVFARVIEMSRVWSRDFVVKCGSSIHLLKAHRKAEEAERAGPDAVCASAAPLARLPTVEHWA